MVSVVAKNCTACVELRNLHSQDVIRQEKKAKKSELADARCQEHKRRLQRLVMGVKEAVLERLRNARRKEEEAPAVQREAMRSRDIIFKAEGRSCRGREGLQIVLTQEAY